MLGEKYSHVVVASRARGIIMDVVELKFLLKLLGFTDYRAPISQIKPNPKTSVSERDSICRTLADREFVAYSNEVTQFSITPAGKALLALDTTQLPIADEELQVLQAAASGFNTPDPTGISASLQQTSIQSLVDRGLMKADKTQIKEVWLTERGAEYLTDEYNPSGSDPVISLDMLTNYLRFIRKSLRQQALSVTPTVEPVVTPEFSSQPSVSQQILGEAEILQLIKDLDRDLGTDNYLPIFYLREKLQPPLSRDEVNQILYRLQRNDRIELSSLQEAIAYTPEQIEAGIPQDIGGPLFFIIVTR
jgi:predicted transcriptional regulator